MFRGFQAIAQGESHKEKELPCQDAVLYKIYKNGGIVIAADGHGSEKHFRSGQGSQMAVDAAREGIEEFVIMLTGELRERRKKKERRTDMTAYMEEQLKQLERHIIARWRQKTLRHFEENPLNEAETKICLDNTIAIEQENNRVRAYGTTLIAAMLQRNFWFAVQIGDGKCVLLDEAGNPSFPVPDDESMGGGRTTSLCDSNAAGNFRHNFGFKPAKGLTVATDGVSDSFVPDAYLEFHTRLYEDIIRDEKTAQEGMQKALPQWSINGSRDDVAMAGIFFAPDTPLAETLPAPQSEETNGGHYAG
jgi:serine/threonine protein phosphatase PrpC